MPELMVDVISSLDGCSSAEGWPGLWGMGGPEYFAWLEEDAPGTYTCLLGANTYRLFTGFVESGEEDMRALTAMDKIVFSSTLKAPLSWANTRLISDDAADVVRGMKRDGASPCAPSAASVCVGHY